MQEPKRGESPEKELKERKSEATSKETLKDLEESQKLSESNTSASDQSVASPDGQANERHSDRADGSDTGGPM
ncbi:MAG TPA: hypothetical protein VE135_04430 [Pyrinomonadaceae bacterium]|nr:hypothetical protein [Pyrinomonadaceae bacterium]